MSNHNLCKRSGSSPSLLPEEMILEILKYLPTKALTRFKAVSKEWLRQISSPSFGKTRKIFDARMLFVCDYAPRNVFSCFVYPRIEAVKRMSPLLEPMDTPVVILVGSVRGIVCISTYHPVEILHLWNPCTGQVKKVPEIPDVAYAYNGFGYDEDEDDFIVVRVVRMKTIWVFSLRKNCWEIRCETLFHIDSDAKFVHGCFYWMLFVRFDQISDLGFHWKVVKFDMRRNSVTEIPQLVGPDRDVGVTGVYLKELGGELYVEVNYDRIVHLWKFNGRSWARTLVGNFNQIIDEGRIYEIVSAFQGEDILVAHGASLIKFHPGPECWDINRIDNQDVQRVVFNTHRFDKHHESEREIEALIPESEENVESSFQVITYNESYVDL